LPLCLSPYINPPRRPLSPLFPSPSSLPRQV
jgi:hypothetical protein